MPRAQPVRLSVDRVIAADAQTLYHLIADVTRMGSWSPETVRASWLDGATGPAVGVRFAGRNQLGSASWTTRPTITVAEPGRRFAFQVPGRSGPLWTYEFEPVTGGTRVTESVAQPRRSPLPIRLLQRHAGVVDRAAHLKNGMITTLDRLAASAESTDPSAIPDREGALPWST